MICDLPSVDVLHDIIKCKAFVGTPKFFDGVGLTDSDVQILQVLAKHGFVAESDEKPDYWQCTFKALEAHSVPQIMFRSSRGVHRCDCERSI